MNRYNRILIGIQAKSGTLDLPNKALDLIEGEPVLMHSINQAKACASYYRSRPRPKHVDVAVLYPKGDTALITGYKWNTTLIAGSDLNVLSRYALAIDSMDYGFIMRVTAGSPSLESHIMTKMITYACENEYDYVGNCGDLTNSMRTFPDGWDCEVMSRKLIHKLNGMELSAYDREHVTSFIRREHPEWAKIGHVIGHIDLSEIKLSINTRDDLAREIKRREELKSKVVAAEKRYGKIYVHRF